MTPILTIEIEDTSFNAHIQAQKYATINISSGHLLCVKWNEEPFD